MIFPKSHKYNDSENSTQTSRPPDPHISQLHGAWAAADLKHILKEIIQIFRDYSWKKKTRFRKDRIILENPSRLLKVVVSYGVIALSFSQRDLMGEDRKEVKTKDEAENPVLKSLTICRPRPASKPAIVVRWEKNKQVVWRVLTQSNYLKNRSVSMRQTDKRQ